MHNDRLQPLDVDKNAKFQGATVVADQFAATEFEHRLTVSSPATGVTQVCGETTWTVRGQPELWVQWPWAEIAEDLFAIADPLQVKTSFRLIAPSGDDLSARDTLLHLMRLVTSLEWQDEIRRYLRSNHGDKQPSNQGRLDKKT